MELSEIPEFLLSLYEEVSTGNGSRAVVISGMPGVGKTHAVQTFYKMLSAKQSQPHFWPTQIVPESEMPLNLSDVLKSRKVIFPDPNEISQDASMDWMW